MAVHEDEPNPFILAHHLVAFAHNMTTPAGRTELVVHVGGFLFSSPDDPRLQYTLADWPNHPDELDWMTPPLSLKNLLGLNDLVGQCMTNILNVQIQRELQRRQEAKKEGEEAPTASPSPDSILSSLWDVSLRDVDLDPSQGGTDAKA